MYHQFNVVTNVEDVPHTVLVRALEPVEGIELMRKRRRGRADHSLTSGPGKLCLALGIDRKLDRADLLGVRAWIEEGRGRILPSAIAAGRRIGIDYAGEWADKPWRFWIRAIPSSAGEGRARSSAPDPQDQICWIGREPAAVRRSRIIVSRWIEVSRMYSRNASARDRA